MPNTSFHNRCAVSIENEFLRVTVTEEGGHVVEICDKQSGVNPLWIPPWPSIEPSAFCEAEHPEYGSGLENKFLSGVMGHNLCLDIFGGPSPDEFAAGFGLHGEASVVPYDISESRSTLKMRATLPLAEIRFTRILEIHG